MPEIKQKPLVSKLLPSKEELEDFAVPDYNDEEKEYIKRLQKRLEKAKRLRDEPREEFDNNSYADYYNANEKYANTYLESKKNKGETTFQSGTLRTKMMSFINAFQAMNISTEITAFGENNLPIQALGTAFEDINDKIDELENDEERKMLRQYEMVKQGSIFIEETYENITETHKTISSGEFGQVKGVKINVKEVSSEGKFKRTIISSISVFLGNLRKYFIEEQPYLFTVEIWDRSDAEKIYGNWERWKYVSKQKRSFMGSTEEMMINNAWRLIGEHKENQVERIVYQDKPNNEIQIVLNGVVMLPPGYPLTAISPDGEYTIIQQNLEPIRHDFAYGKSFVFKHKNIILLLDEMTKLAVLKTQKSFLPPHLNLSGRVVTSKIFMPAVITKGIRPGEIQPLSPKESEGVTNAEFNMIQEIIRFVDANTASQTFTGAREPGAKPTATQITELQRQARLMMGIILLAAMMLEKKLTQKRNSLILRYWFNPIDNQVDQARNQLINKYRQPIVRQTYISQEGRGSRMTILSETIPSPDQIKAEEQRLKELYGSPIKITIINPKQINEAKLTWQIIPTEKPKKTSDLTKVMFAEEITAAKNLGLVPNPGWLQQKFAEIWENDPNKMFSQEGIPQQLPQGIGFSVPEQLTRIKRPVSLNISPAEEATI